MKMISLILFMIMCGLSCVSAKTISVATNGNDTNNGTITQPFLTFKRGLEELSPGDSLVIRKGTYREKISISQVTSSDKWTFIGAYNDEEVIIEAEDIPVEIAPDGINGGDDGVIAVHYSERITISGFTIRNSNGNGIYVGHSNYIIVRDNHTNNTFNSGIGVWFTTNVAVQSNEVVLACNGGGEECISVGGCDTFEISNNHVHHGADDEYGGEGIDAKHGTNGKIFGNHVHDIKRLGIYVDAWDVHTHSIEVYNNRIHDCYPMGICVGAENGGLLENIKIYNNLCYDNKAVGIGVQGEEWGEDTLHPIRNIYITNNTLYNNGYDVWGAGIEVNGDLTENIFIQNNIISKSYWDQIDISSDVQNCVIENNLLHGESEIKGDNHREGDPMFVNPTQYDFRLKDNSPAINGGLEVVAPAFDYDNSPRPAGDAVDMGAFEHSQSTTNNENGIVTKAISPVSFISSGEGISISIEKEIVDFEVFDIRGRQIYSQNAISPQSNIVWNTSSVAVGNYIMKISTDAQKMYHQITVQ